MLPKAVKEEMAGNILRMVIPFAFVANLAIALLIIIAFPERQHQAIPPVFYCLIILPAWVLYRRGKPLIGVPLLLLCLAFPILSGMIFNGGIKALVFIGTLPIMFVIFCLYGQRKTIVYAITVFLTGALFAFLDMKQLLPVAQQQHTMLVLGVYGIWLAVTFLLTCAPVKIMLDSLALSDRKRQETEKAFARTQAVQKELKKSEAFQKRLFESSSVPIVVLGTETNRFIDCNPAAAEIYRFSSVAETIGKTPLDVSAPFQYDGSPSLEKARYYMEKAVEDGIVVFEWRHQRPDGETWDAEVHLMSFTSENHQLLQFTLNDITERKKVETEVLREKNFSEAVINQLPGSFYMFDKDGCMLRWNKQLEKVTGYAADEIQSMLAFDFFPETDRNHIRRQIQYVFGSGPSHIETDFMTRDGRRVPHFLTAAAIEYNEATYILGVGLDATERKKTETALQESEEKYRQLIENANDAIYIAQDGRIVFFNGRTIEMLGYDKTELQEAPIAQFIHPDDRALVADRHFRRLAGEKNLPSTYSFKIIRKDGTVRSVQLGAVLVQWNGIPATLNFLRDITEVRHLEEMMIQNEKMLSVGGLAAGMAHEINNPLAGMLQTANVMARRLGNLDTPANQRTASEIGIEMEGIKTFVEKKGILRMLTTIMESGRRIADIVNNMLSFARKGDSLKAFHNLNRLIDQSLELAATDYSLKKHYDFKKIQIVKEYEGNLPGVVCEGAKIQQVLLNVLTNGAQAMQSVETKDPRFLIRTILEKEEGMISIHIADNGPGMDEETRKHVFEPFFTTKPVGVGTGLGLSVSYFIITENHSGEMSVDSQAGMGTEFIIRLPVSPQGQKDGM